MFISLYSVLTKKACIKVYITLLLIQLAGGTLPDFVSRAMITPIYGVILEVGTE